MRAAAPYLAGKFGELPGQAIRHSPLVFADLSLDYSGVEFRQQVHVSCIHTHHKCSQTISHQLSAEIICYESLLTWLELYERLP